VTAARTLAVIVRTELRLLVRRSSLWLYIGLLVALTTALGLTTLRTGWQEMLVSIVNNIAFFEFPVLAFLAASAVVRSRGRAVEWLAPCPTEAPLLWLGQFLGLAACVLAALLVPLLTGWAVTMLQGHTPWQSLPGFLGYGLLLLAPATLLELGIAYSLSLWLRRPALVAALAAGVDALLWLGVLLPTATLLTPLNHTLLTLHLDPVAGLGADRSLLLSLLALYSLTSLALLAASMAGASLADGQARWRGGHGWRIGLALAVALAGTCLAAWAYQGTAKTASVPAPVVAQGGLWTVETAAHTVEVDGASLSARADLTLTNRSGSPQDVVQLVMNGGLSVRAATIDGAAATVTRQGEALLVAAPRGSISAQQRIDVRLIYAGALHLLREDYQLATAIRGQDPAEFSVPVRGYQDARTLLLERDGDWRAWPTVTGAHHAAIGEAITLTVQGAAPFACSGALLRSSPTLHVYVWHEQTPQLLWASGAYQAAQLGAGSALLPSTLDRRDATRAQNALALRQALAVWLAEPPQPEPYRVVVLPYARQVALGGSVIGLPALSSASGIPAAGVTFQGTTARSLASQIGQAWLEDRVAWPGGELNAQGQFRRFVIEFGPPDAQGHQEQTLRNLGGPNPQAPWGRWTQSPSPSFALRALAVVLGQAALEEVELAGGGSTDEGSLWSSLSGTDLPDPAARSVLATLVGRGLLSDGDDPEGARQVATLVAALQQLRRGGDDASLAAFVSDLALRYPAGGEPLTDDVFCDLLDRAVIATGNASTSWPPGHVNCS
jgi:hypothetical protein